MNWTSFCRIAAQYDAQKELSMNDQPKHEVVAARTEEPKRPEVDSEWTSPGRPSEWTSPGRPSEWTSPGRPYFYVAFEADAYMDHLEALQTIASLREEVAKTTHHPRPFDVHEMDGKFFITCDDYGVAEVYGHGADARRIAYTLARQPLPPPTPERPTNPVDGESR
jgi:hypothetical protein